MTNKVQKFIEDMRGGTIILDNDDSQGFPGQLDIFSQDIMPDGVSGYHPKDLLEEALGMLGITVEYC